MFTQKFSKYVCENDTITTQEKGLIFTAKIVRDWDYDIDDDDSHNPDQRVTGCNAKQQKQLLAAREAWKKDEWFYCGVVISVSTDRGTTLSNHAASLWGIEANYPDSDNSYLTEVANELLDEAREEATRKIQDWADFATKYLS